MKKTKTLSPEEAVTKAWKDLLISFVRLPDTDEEITRLLYYTLIDYRRNNKASIL